MIKARRKARSGEYHECACPRFGQDAPVRRPDLGICRRRDRRPRAASETAVAEIFLRRRGIGAVRADHGAAGILSDPHRTRRFCATAATRSPRSSRRARRWWNSAPAPPPRSGCCWNACEFGAYVPVDISGDFLNAQADAPAQGFPRPRRLSGGRGFHRAVRPAGRDRRHAEGRLLPGIDARQFRAA